MNSTKNADRDPGEDLLQGDQDRKMTKHVQKFVHAEKPYNEAREKLKKDKAANRDRDKGRQSSATARWYAFALLGIGALEWLINYESFSGFFNVPAIAIGWTIAVAIMVAVASHVHGEWCKQPIRREQLRDGEQSDQGYRLIFWLVSVGFVVALGFVVAVRYQSWSDLSGLGVELSVWPKVSIALASNVIVWLLGVWVAYVAHSEGHYTKYHRGFNRTRKRYEMAEKTLKDYQSKLGVGRSLTEEEKIADLIERKCKMARTPTAPLILAAATVLFVQTADAQFSSEYDIDQFCSDTNVAAANPIRRTVVYVDETVVVPSDFATDQSHFRERERALAIALGRSEWYAQLESKLTASLMASERVAVVLVRANGDVEEVAQFCWPDYGKEQRIEISSRGWERFFVANPLDDLETQRDIAFARVRSALAKAVSEDSLSSVGKNYVRALSRDEGRLRNQRGQFVRVIFYGGMIEDSEYGTVLSEDSPRNLARRAVERTSMRLGGASFYLYGVRDASDDLLTFWNELFRRGGGQLAALGSDLALVAKVPTAIHGYSLEVDVAPPERVRRGRATVLVAEGGEIVDGAVVLAGTFRSALSGNLSCSDEDMVCSSQCSLRAETTRSVYFKSLPAERLELTGTGANLEGYIGEGDDGQPSRAYAAVSAKALGCE